MEELFRQIGFINALLGGFAIAFLSQLLTSSAQHRVVNWVVAIITVASACFILSAIGATFSAVVAHRASQGNLPEDLAALHKAISLLFLVGSVFLFAGIGMSGWIRSNRLGIATTVIMSLSLIGGYFIMLPFMQ